jgi:hypothetical protein
VAGKRRRQSSTLNERGRAQGRIAKKAGSTRSNRSRAVRGACRVLHASHCAIEARQLVVCHQIFDVVEELAGQGCHHAGLKQSTCVWWVGGWVGGWVGVQSVTAKAPNSPPCYRPKRPRLRPPAGPPHQVVLHAAELITELVKLPGCLILLLGPKQHCEHCVITGGHRVGTGWAQLACCAAAD